MKKILSVAPSMKCPSGSMLILRVWDKLPLDPKTMKNEGFKPSKYGL